MSVEAVRSESSGCEVSGTGLTLSNSGLDAFKQFRAKPTASSDKSNSLHFLIKLQSTFAYFGLRIGLREHASYSPAHQAFRCITLVHVDYTHDEYVPQRPNQKKRFSEEKGQETSLGNAESRVQMDGEVD